MKSFLLLYPLVAVVSCLVIDIRTPVTDGIVNRPNEFQPVKGLPKHSIESKPRQSSPLEKRTRDYNQYAHQYPNNLVPDFVVCNTRDGHNSQMYTQQDIWDAVETGFAYINPNGGLIHPLARFRDRFYPHQFLGVDEALNFAVTGVGDWNHAFEFPLMPAGGQAWNGGGNQPGPDRVVFDIHGVYMGVVTHRGEARLGFHWGQPTDINAVGRNFGGVPGYDTDVGYRMPVGGYLTTFSGPHFI